nr:DUF2442 domain-containing protein [uncultured Caproiciproducens sp.]
MSKIIGVTPNDNFTILIEFEHGNKILFNMQEIIKTMPFSSLHDIKHFKDIWFEDKAVYWKEEKQTVIPARLTVDNILFALRD